MIEHAMNICRSNAKCAVAYHYCNFRDNLQSDCSDFMASLVDQLQSQASSISPTLRQLYEDRDRDQQASRNVELLTEALRELVSSFKKVFLYVDALDEFDDRHIDDLMLLLSSIKKWGIPSLHMLITSQCHQLSIRAPLEALAPPGDRLDLVSSVNGHQGDICRHIRLTLDESPKFYQRWAEDKNGLLSDIQETLARRSDGSYVESLHRFRTEC